MASKHIGWAHVACWVAWGLLHCAIAVPAAASSGPSPLQAKIAPMVGPEDSVLVEAPTGHKLVGIHEDRERVPASILKILTSLAAIDTLGAEFHFKTEFFVDPENNLKIKGYGDPLMVSERLAVICGHLAARLDTVGNIILDDTYFSQPIRIPGRGTSLEPYDAPNGALCVNFNTVAFTRRNGRWISDEPQTPLLPSVIPLIEASGLSTGRITLAAGREEALDYAGAMFRYFLNQNGTTVIGSIVPGRIVPEHDRMIWQYQSDADLAQAVSKLLEYSNNFIANQILLIMGAEVKGPPASMDKGLAVLRAYYRDKLQLRKGRIVEASGISRQNRISARAMMTILKRFSPYHKLMRKQNRQYYKTGHLKGIRSRAGYIASRDGKLYRFVVIVNTPGKSTHRIMKVLEKELR
jgi:serine-type D-Ala-D-Ala carboxypeptidase/endopeptidase (penicillin-binding protein 4)